MPAKQEPQWDFRAMEPGDLSMVGEWIARPHWQEWWGDPLTEMREMETSLDSDSVEQLIVELDGEAFAWAQSYDPHLEEDHPYGDQPFGTLGIDLSIAEQAMTGKGFGSSIVKALAEILFDEGAVRLVIDPHPDNKRAIAAYEKAGFEKLGERNTKFGRVALMARDTTETDE